jgi:HTH-type transcriptional regulator / antitoxin MqsA
MTNQTCHECGYEMVHDVRPMTIVYKGQSATFDMPGLYCTSCSEGVLSGKDGAIYDQNLNRLKAQADGLLLPEQIRRIRKSLGLTQAEASAVLGGGPNAFHRYESGTGLPSQAISNLLRLLAADARGLELLRRHDARHEDVAADEAHIATRSGRPRSRQPEMVSTG